MRICELEQGQLFVYDRGATAQRLHVFSHNTYRPDNTLEYSRATQIAELIDGVWVHRQCEQERWNPLADVSPVKILVGPA